MIITAWYMNRKVLLGVTPDMLVFDGSSWVSPATAKWVALRYFGTATSEPRVYPVQYETEHHPLNWKNYWVCRVLSVNPNGIMPTDVLEVVDPNDGECLCGVTCLGTEYKDIKVYTERLT
jgi:hypothetical protein